jgi:hypothetical protein
MDDRSAPSARVRHEYQGLGVVLPPAYLFSFVRDHEEEPIAGSKDLPLYIRSRMPGVLGLTWRSDELSAADRATIREEIQRGGTKRSPDARPTRAQRQHARHTAAHVRKACGAAGRPRRW